MKKRFSTTLIGLFVIGAAFLTVVGFFAFAGKGWWRETQEFVIFFDESVQGLERGSAVRLMGVRVGAVSQIQVRYDAELGGRAQVICEVDRSRLMGPGGREIDMRDREELRRLIEEGLAARLNLVGITGMLFVELNFFPELAQQEIQPIEDNGYLVVPAVPSVMTGLTDNVAQIARRLERVDFEGIAESVERVLDTTDRVLLEAQIPEFVAELSETVGKVNELLDSEEMTGAIASARAAFEELSRVSRRLDNQIDPVADSLVASSEEFRETVAEAAAVFERIQELTGPRLGLGPQASETLSSLNEAARSVQRLADFLERNPQAILSGRRGD